MDITNDFNEMLHFDEVSKESSDYFLFFFQGSTDIPVYDADTISVNFT